MAITTHALKVWRGTADQYAAFVSGNTVDPNTLYYVAPAAGDLTGMCYRGADPMGMRYRAVTAFPTENIEQGVLYLGPAGEAKFYTGSDWVVVCYPLRAKLEPDAEGKYSVYAAASAAAVVEYVNTFAAGLGRLHPAVSTITDLANIPDAADRDLVLVEDQAALFRFEMDAPTGIVANGTTVIAYTDANGKIVGYWIKMLTVADMKAEGVISISDNVITLSYSEEQFTISEDGNLILNPTYMQGITNSIAAAQAAAEAAQADATQALADAADAQSTADDAIPKLINAEGTRVALTTIDGTITESSMTVGGNALGTTAALRENKLATETAVQAAVDGKITKISDAEGGKVATTVAGGVLAESDYVIGAGTTAAATENKATTLANQAYVDKAVADLVAGEDLQDVVQDAIQATVATELANKMDRVTAGTANNLVALDANGNAKDSGKTAGDSTLAETPTASVLATEAAVAAAVSEATSDKMDKVASPTAGNLVGMDANGNSTNSGKTVGGSTLAETPTASVLATEAAVAAAVATAKEEAINGAKIFWYEGSDA